MTSPLEPGDENFEAAASQLNAGLRTCRSVLSNYRSLLAGEREGHAQSDFTESGEFDEGPLD